MTDKLQIAIVGAGIGGLIAALALRARGLNVTVFERALSPREAGAGISIQPNAARLLKRIGLHDRLENIGTKTVGLSLRTSRGEPVPTPPASADNPSYQVHRVELLEMLNDAQAESAVRFGHHCTGVRETDAGARLSFANGITADDRRRSGRYPLGRTTRDRPDNISDERRNYGLPRLDPVGETFVGGGSSRAEDVDGVGPQFPVLSGFEGKLGQHGRLCAKQS